ncbi:MAG: aminotransferase class IV [Bacteroidales bacterium]|jgi:branched-subunit amino acid aminotransferase/4-amino-4-deoxychorismate lyase|nr:aminotransferase class IV [Bacteroidales bacterium]
MAINSFILYNGSYHYIDEFGLSFKNRAFCYGDALFETIHANGTEIQFFEDHIARLKYGMKILKMEVPTIIETGFIEKEIIKLLHKNKLYQGVRIRLSVFRNEGGKYTPTDNNISYLVETEYIDNDHYELNQKGLIIDIFKEIRKPVNVFSSLKSANALLYVMAGSYAKEKNLGDCILLNEKENIVEGISSNIFLVKGDVLSTPPLKDGPVAGIMRKQILKIADSNGLKINFEDSLNETHLLSADEVFLTNSISGIRWVLAYKDRRYFSNIAHQFIEKLNMLVF